MKSRARPTEKKRGVKKPKNKKLRPEAKIGTAVIVGGFLIASSVYIMRENQPARVAEANIQFEEIAVQSQTDTDGDGLFDWEEDVWKTDPAIADTDGDGTNDGEEIAFGRNPIVAGPLDDLPPSKDPFDPLLPDPEGGNNYTDMASYVIAQQISERGSNIDTELVQEIFNKLPSTTLSLRTPYPITSSELTLVSGASEATLKNYVETIISIEEKASEDTSGRNELVIYADALENDITLLSELDPIITGYDEIIENLTTTPVPAILHRQHLAYLNNARQVQLTLKAMRQYGNDTLLGIIGISTYLVRINSFISVRDKIFDELQEQGITI
jgi:hypothetical protein